MTDFLGRGWAYPVAFAPDGDAAMAAADEDIRQAVLVILQTEPGDRVMRPDFGVGLRSLVFEPMNTTTRSLVKHEVQQALIAWEPRIDVTEVTVTADPAGRATLLIQIHYRIRETNTFYNLVYPFYLQQAGS